MYEPVLYPKSSFFKFLVQKLFCVTKKNIMIYVTKFYKKILQLFDE